MTAADKEQSTSEEQHGSAATDRNTSGSEKQSSLATWSAPTRAASDRAQWQTTTHCLDESSPLKAWIPTIQNTAEVCARPITTGRRQSSNQVDGTDDDQVMASPNNDLISSIATIDYRWSR